MQALREQNRSVPVKPVIPGVSHHLCTNDRGGGSGSSEVAARGILGNAGLLGYALDLRYRKDAAMTVIVSVKINDGIVLAADSAGSMGSGQVYAHANKITNLCLG